VAVDLDAGVPLPAALGRSATATEVLWPSLPLVIVGLTTASSESDPTRAIPREWLDVIDVAVHPAGSAMADLEQTFATNPVAATVLALLLRGSDRRGAAEGLAAESAAYSTLQAGPEFARWRAGRPMRDRVDDDQPRVRCRRHGDRLEITLSRPDTRNALDARMRDELCEAFLLAALDDALNVHIQGEGSSFCAGGDLDEMGSRDDPATAHLTRLHRSPARLLATVASRTMAHLHGACVGSGVELPAFAARVVVAPDTFFCLPEVRLGLVPGAGGTVSLPARIGRHRTAWLALTGRQVDATTAIAWGLADDQT